MDKIQIDHPPPAKYDRGELTPGKHLLSVIRRWQGLYQSSVIFLIQAKEPSRFRSTIVHSGTGTNLLQWPTAMESLEGL